MFYFTFLILILIIYILVLHFRWEKKRNEFLKRIKEEEAKIIHMEKMASIGTLAAGIAHEINNPLAFLVINLEILLNCCKEKDKMQETEQIITECLEGAERINRIVKDLLTFSHRGQGERRQVDVNDLLDSTLRIVWNEIKYKVDLIKDYRAKNYIWVDPTQVSQVIVNIVINAYQAIKEKGTITISTYEDTDFAYIKISDTGGGMPKEIMGKIFEPFFTTKGGPGLGLSVSNEIIKSYGGKIEVESKVGYGTSFIVVIPKEDRIRG